MRPAKPLCLPSVVLGFIWVWDLCLKLTLLPLPTYCTFFSTFPKSWLSSILRFDLIPRTWIQQFVSSNVLEILNECCWQYKNKIEHCFVLFSRFFPTFLSRNLFDDIQSLLTWYFDYNIFTLDYNKQYVIKNIFLISNVH